MDIRSPRLALYPLLIDYMPKYEILEKLRSDRRRFLGVLDKLEKLATPTTTARDDMRPYYRWSLDLCRLDLEPLEQKLLSIGMRMLR